MYIYIYIATGPGPPTPTPPPPARLPFISFIHDITAVDKNHLKIQQLDGRFSYKSIAT